MQRTEFEQRLNQILDERGNPALDEQLCAAAERDEECRAMLAAFETLAVGLARRSPVELDNDLSPGVIRDLHRPLSAFRLPASAMLWVPVSIAALVVIAVLAQGLRPKTDPIAAPASSGSYAQAEPSSPHKMLDNSEGFPSDVGEMRPTQDADDEAYFSMLRRTGQAMAILPDTIMRGDMPPELNAMAEGMRPVRNSVSAALDALRGTLPSKTRETES